ncbi:alpha-D-ribose 1-methylphosphonate 5-phosphate C-P-lyase PhnJ [Streptomyces sp. NPDC004752]
MQLLDQQPPAEAGYRFGYLDEPSKHVIRQAILKAICLPGHLVPFASRHMPVARGWGSGGLQVTLATITRNDTVKVIDEGDDETANAIGLRDLIARTCGVDTTTDAGKATVIQSRHRIPETDLAEGQVLVFQLPYGDPLRSMTSNSIVMSPSERRRMHAEGDYDQVWLGLFEQTLQAGRARSSLSHPVEVNGGYTVTVASPRWDLPRLNNARFISLFGMGREGYVFAIPPYTKAVPLSFEDRPFVIESFSQPCDRCGSTSSYRVKQHVNGTEALVCTDVDACTRRQVSA